MRIGIVGGTGKEGLGLGLRWARAGHEVIIGSRDAERARAKAAGLAAAAPGARVSGMSNRDAAAAADLVVLTLPANGLGATLGDLKDACRGKIVISTVVPLTFGGGRLFTPATSRSSATCYSAAATPGPNTSSPTWPRPWGFARSTQALSAMPAPSRASRPCSPPSTAATS